MIASANAVINAVKNLKSVTRVLRVLVSSDLKLIILHRNMTIFYSEDRQDT